MDFHGFLRSRRSIRNFKDLPVGPDVIARMLETAVHAPSAHNRQPWRFAAITAEAHKVRLSELLAADFRRDLEKDSLSRTEIDSRVNRSRSRITHAPLVVILCMDMSEMDVYNDDGGIRTQAERTMATQSVAAAGLQLQLAARAEGLDSVWTCGPLFAPETVRTALSLPEKWEPQAMFFIGYASEPPRPKELKPLVEVVKYY
jgi:F420 biosynthesis protein FbiB-like protein